MLHPYLIEALALDRRCEPLAARKAQALLHHNPTGSGNGLFGQMSAVTAAPPQAQVHTAKERTNDALRDSYSHFVPGRGRRTSVCGRGRPAPRHPVGRSGRQGGQRPVGSGPFNEQYGILGQTFNRGPAKDAWAERARVAQPARPGVQADRVDALVNEHDAAAAGEATMVLTARELDVLKVVAEGLSNSEIAQRLFLSRHTVHRHVANILRKLNVPSRAAAAAWGVRTGIV